MTFDFKDMLNSVSGSCPLVILRCKDRRFWAVIPHGDHFLVLDSSICVMDDFGNLVRVGRLSVYE